MRSVSDEERRRRIAVRHRLVPGHRARDVASVVDACVGLHSSDPASVFLSACARTTEPSIEAVENALYRDRVAVRMHAMRRTLWVVTPAVALAANAAFTRRVAQTQRKRTAKLFGRDEEWLADAVDRVTAVVRESSGPVHTRAIGELIPDLADPVVVNPGKRYETRVAPHSRALLHAAFEGAIVRTRPAGSWIGSQYAWEANERWLDLDWTTNDELEGTVEVLGRWLDGFGPGTVDDLAWWTGGTKTQIRRALDQLDVEAVQFEHGEEGLVMAGDADPVGDVGPWVAVLPGLDPTAMGWKERSWYLAPDVADRVVDRNGNIGPTVWVDGHIVGGWVQRPDGTIAHDVEVGALSDMHRALLDLEIDRIRSVVGDDRFSVRFPAPNQVALLG